MISNLPPFRYAWVLPIVVCWATAAIANTPYVRLEVSPSNVALTGSRAAAQILVTAHHRDGHTIDVTRQAQLGKSGLVTSEGGYLRARQNGKQTVAVVWEELSTTLDIDVTQTEMPHPVSFRNETLAVLTKQGCNSGACHGKPNGRGALELSLNAFDPQLDERNLIRGSLVRFTDTLVPEASLLLKKPTLRVTHGGGKRLRDSDDTYALLRQWIAEGCQSDRTRAAACTKVTIAPARRVVQLQGTDGSQQVRVMAHFADGSSRDVTRVASYSASNEDIATSGRHGLVTGKQRGQTAVVVRYLDWIGASHMTFVAPVPGFQWQTQPEANYVDVHVHNKLRQLQVQPSSRCSDATFLRRLSLDVRGLLPSAAEAREFLSSQQPNKREVWIDRYLAAPEYGRFWGLKMADLLRVNGQVLSAEQATAYSQWIRDAVQSNQPYDQFVSELLTATGATSQVLPANFFRVTSDTKMVTETVTQLFMGSRIMCAQCHNHPYESWTQDNYYQIGAAFHDLDRKVLGDKKKRLPAAGSDVAIVRSPPRDWNNPRTGMVQKPWPTSVTRAEGEDKRQAFAKWLTDPDNPFFAKVAVNRMWAELFGRGLVHPGDDFRSSNPATNEKLLVALASDFVKSGYDRKHLLRTILQSRTYQRSAATNAFNQQDSTLHSHAYVRLLTAEQLQDAIKRLCEENKRTQLREQMNAFETQLAQNELSENDRAEMEKQLQGKQKVLETFFMTQQHYPQLTTFLKAFGQPERKTACACERQAEVNLDQALQLMNSPLIRQQLNSARAALEPLDNERLVDELYLRAYSRFPTAAERATVQRHLADSADRPQAIEDLVWALINTNEFIFQH